MYTPGLVSVVIPSRNEPYLHKTINDLLAKAKGNIEVIALLDGYWPDAEEIIEHPRVIYIHRGEARGMRAGINAGVAIAKGEYVLKTDAHCMFAEGFDVKLVEDSDMYSPGWPNQVMYETKDDWVVVPRRLPLDPVNWEIEKRSDMKYPVDYMYLSKDLHGEPWPERRDDPKHKDLIIDDLMSAQGSCWFMKHTYYEKLKLLDEEKYGTFYSEFQEIGLKCWATGGAVKVNKGTWYAHWHKPKEVGRGYNLAKGEKEKAEEAVAKWREMPELKSLVKRFAPVPTWEGETQ